MILSSFIVNEVKIYGQDAYRMYFTSNHDENSWYGTEKELFGDAADAFAVLTMTLSSMPLIYSGQEAALDKRLLFFDKDQVLWKNYERGEFYTKLLHLKKENQALWNGDKGGVLQRVPTTDNANIFAFIREKNGDKVFVVLNLSDEQKNVKLGETSFIGTYHDLFSDELIVIEEGTNFNLSPWSYLVCELKAADEVKNRELPMDNVIQEWLYPNPFNSTTKFSFSLAVPSNIQLSIFNLLGRKIRFLDLGIQTSGLHEIVISAFDLPSGQYIFCLTAGNYQKTGRFTVLR